MTHTENGSSAMNQLAQQRRYRRLMFGSIIAGVAIALLLREGLGYTLAGEVVYWLGILGFFAVWKFAPTTLFDERDWELERRASQLTMSIIVVVLVVGAAVGRVLPEVSTYALPEVVWPMLYAYVSVFVVFAVSYTYLRYGR